MEDRTKGAWIIHHTNKIERFDSCSGFNEVYTAGKCGKLLSAITASDEESFISKEKLDVLAEASKINNLEQKAIVQKLIEQKLIDKDNVGNIIALGVTQTSLLKHTSKLFEDEKPNDFQRASIALSEYVSEAPMTESLIKEKVGDEFRLTGTKMNQLLLQATSYRIVDSESLGDEKLLFNGNIFRRDSIEKTNKVLNSISSVEQVRVLELNEKLETEACIQYSSAVKIIGEDLFKKLHSIGFYDVSSVANSKEKKYLVTLPVAFAKFGDGLVDDAMDLAKAFVSSLTYGMKYSDYYRGKIVAFEKLMQRLIDGHEVGAATAIGQDYKALEFKGVVSTRPSKDKKGQYYMKLLKKDVGKLALEVLRNGNAIESVVFKKLNSNVHTYAAPEINREEAREKERKGEDKYGIAEKLSVLRK